MALPDTAAQGPALNGIIYAETDQATSMMAVKVYDRPREVTLGQIKEYGYLYVRYLVPLKDLNKFFDYDGSKVLHTAPDLKADLYRKISKGAPVPNSESTGTAGISAGRYLAYCHSRALRGVKFGFRDVLKLLSGDLRVSGYEYENEMKLYYTKADPDEWVIVDVVADVLPTNDKVMVEAVKARVWGLVDDSYLPYTAERVGIRVAGLNFVSDPQAGAPNVGDYLTKRTGVFKSKGVVEKVFLDGLKTAMGSYVQMPATPAAPSPAPTAAN